MSDEKSNRCQSPMQDIYPINKITSKNRKTTILTTCEPINVKYLQDLASRRAAGVVCWDGSNVPIRHIILDLVAAAKDGYLCPTWEGASVSYGVPSRMHATGFSLFRLPKALRAVGRSGLGNCVDVDQRNAHPQAQLVRHPGRAALQRYVGEREAALKEVFVVCVDVTRDDAKGLF